MEWYSPEAFRPCLFATSAFRKCEKDLISTTPTGLTWRHSGLLESPYRVNYLCIETLLSLGESLRDVTPLIREYRWINMIIQPASAYLGAKKEDMDIASRLVDLGRRRSESFLLTDRLVESFPCFGLMNLVTLLNCLNGPEGRIALLRRVASRFCHLETQDTIIRYRVDLGPKLPARRSKRLHDSLEADGKGPKTETETRYATVFP
ncbi:hypothetical protein GJ744_011861 [Endocarpon pusillum]|uniref:Uncharacterized protein n=1 Tax=Endocarpon pusillum TaxID=364733 RepID=A0A8H7E2J6_9EURO|nr:hypothetical protein GJ744_011861 [Endocarpon pusillum]